MSKKTIIKNLASTHLLLEERENIKWNKESWDWLRKDTNNLISFNIGCKLLIEKNEKEFEEFKVRVIVLERFNMKNLILKTEGEKSD